VKDLKPESFEEKGNKQRSTRPKTRSFGYQVLGFGSGGVAPKFVSGTGGCETTSGNFKIHTFNSPGTFCVSCAGDCKGSNTVSYVVVAGGGGGGGGANCGGGGSGGGGFRESKSSFDSYTASPLDACGGLPVSVQGYPITVGGGGSGGSGTGGRGQSGSNSIFSSITSAGGGGGGGGGVKEHQVDHKVEMETIPL